MKCWICEHEMTKIGETDILKDVGGMRATEYKCDTCGEVVYEPIGNKNEK